MLLACVDPKESGQVLSLGMYACACMQQAHVHVRVFSAAGHSGCCTQVLLRKGLPALLEAGGWVVSAAVKQMRRSTDPDAGAYDAEPLAHQASRLLQALLLHGRRVAQLPAVRPTIER